MVASGRGKTIAASLSALCAIVLSGCGSAGPGEGSIRPPVATFRHCSYGGSNVDTYGLERLKNTGDHTVKVTYGRPKKASGAEIIGARIAPPDKFTLYGIGSLSGFPPNDIMDHQSLDSEGVRIIWEESSNVTDIEIPPGGDYHLFIGVYAADITGEPATIEGVLIGYRENGHDYEVEAPATFILTNKEENCPF